MILKKKLNNKFNSYLKNRPSKLNKSFINIKNMKAYGIHKFIIVYNSFYN